MLNDIKISTQITMRRVFLLASLMLLPSFAYAHVGAGEANGFLLGFAHPVSGLDHICAMLAVGLWAAQMGGRSLWAAPLTFIVVMALGGALPMLGVSLPFAEQGVVLSVLLLGVFIAASVRLPLWSSSSIVGLFALWHGYVHGTEMPTLASEIEYAQGLILVTALLHIPGIALGLGMQYLPDMNKVEGASERLVQAVGGGIALCGIYLAAA